MNRFLLSVLLLLFGLYQALAASVFTTRVEDPQAVYLSASGFGAHGDGASDDAAAIQNAIDKAGHNGREGIVLIPSGRCRLGRTVYVWPGVRIVGYGPTRPVFLLADSTPGFQTGMGVMVMFAGFGPGQLARMGMRVPFPPPGSVPPNTDIADANSGTF